MANDFKYLIEKFGVPKIIIPNTPQIKYLGRGSIVVGTNPEREFDSSTKIFYRRFQFGESEFLAVNKRFETYLSQENLLLEYLSENKLQPIEFIYLGKDARTWDYSTKHWKESKVAITIATDVENIYKADLLKAVEHKRVLSVSSWSSMGDKYVEFRICSADNLPKDLGFHFLFEKNCVLSEEMLIGMGGNFEWEEEFYNCYSEYFTQDFLINE